MPNIIENNLTLHRFGYYINVNYLKGGRDMSKFHKSPNKYVNHIALKVENLKRSLEFYQQIMGLKIIKKEDNKAILSANGIEPILTIEQPENVIPKELRRTGLYHFALLLPNRKELGKLLKNILDKEYPIIGAANHMVSEAIYLQDIDDNGIEIYADTSPSTWEWHNGLVKMDTKPLNIKDIINEAGKDLWKGISEDTIIGHIHLHVSNLQEAERFYVDGLGFNIVSRMSNHATFTSTGGYHHHIAFNIWNGIGAKSPSENSVGLKYFTLKLPDQKAILDTIDKLNKLEYDVKVKDGNFITKDPSGNNLYLVI